MDNNNKKNREQTSIRSSILPLVFFPMLAVAIVLIVSAGLMTTSLVDGVMSDMLLAADANIQHTMDQNEQNALHTADLLGRSTGAKAAAEGDGNAAKQLYDEAQSHFSFDYFAFLDANGSPIYSNSKAFAEQLQASSFLQSDQAAGLLSLADAPIAQLTKTPIEDGASTIIIGFNLSSNRYAAALKQLTGTEVAFGKGGQFISYSSPDNQNLIGEGVTQAASSTVVQNSEPFLADTSKIDGVEYRANYTPLFDYQGSPLGFYWTALIAHDTLLLYGIIIGIVAAVFVIAMLIGSRYINKLVHPLRELEEVSVHIAQGNMGVQIDHNRSDEIGALQQAFIAMVDNIRQQADAIGQLAEGDFSIDIHVQSERDELGVQLEKMIQSNNEAMGNITSAADHVTLGAEQIAGAAQNLAAGATRQAGSVDQISDIMNEIQQQTDTNATYAEDAAGITQDLETMMAQSMQEVGQLVDAMQNINTASQNISKMNKLIEDIAFRTNILALNAAVEAARAGEHGQGFAVVADEVRQLAARSAEAANETTSLVNESISFVNSGSQIVEQTSTSLQKVTKDAAMMIDLVQKISVSSRRQAEGIDRANTELMDVEQVTETNAATSQQFASSSEELSSMAETLKHLVSQFILKDSATNGSLLSAYETQDAAETEWMDMEEESQDDKY